MLILSTPNAMSQVAAALKAMLLLAPGASVHLFQNNIVPSPTNVAADFTEATFDGYASHTLATMFGPTRNADGSFTVYNFQHWAMTGAVTPNTVYGAYCLDQAGLYLFATRFPAPVAMIDTFSTLDCQFSIGVSVNGLAGNFDVEP